VVLGGRVGRVLGGGTKIKLQILDQSTSLMPQPNCNSTTECSKINISLRKKDIEIIPMVHLKSLPEILGFGGGGGGR
jgi:hypothetical protein